MKFHYFNHLKHFKQLAIIFFFTLTSFSWIQTHNLYAFPIYAQQSYENPRETTGRIVCANCHLAQKSVSVEMPKAVLPNTVFEAVIKIPYDNTSQQILSNGKTGNLNIGAILILPKGFKLAPNNMLSEEIKNKMKGVYIQPYSTQQNNILVVGPMPGNKNKEITFPILTPDPSNDKLVHFIKYPVYIGGNRGRGQIYPSGDKSNNNVVSSPVYGKVSQIHNLDQGGYEIVLEKSNQDKLIIKVPQGLKTKVHVGDLITSDQALTDDPNVGGFGQSEAEIVLQDPRRVKAMMAFLGLVTLTQIFFVLKKKQWEKVQAAEINF